MRAFSIGMCGGTAPPIYEFQHVAHLGLAIGIPVRDIRRNHNVRPHHIQPAPSAVIVLQIPRITKRFRDLSRNSNQLIFIGLEVSLTLNISQWDDLGVHGRTQRKGKDEGDGEEGLHGAVVFGKVINWTNVTRSLSPLHQPWYRTSPRFQAGFWPMQRVRCRPHVQFGRWLSHPLSSFAARRSRRGVL